MIEELEIEEVIYKSKNNKAQGEDGIPFEFFKNCPAEFKNLLTITFNRIIERAEVPDTFRSY